MRGFCLKILNCIASHGSTIYTVAGEAVHTVKMINMIFGIRSGAVLQNDHTESRGTVQSRDHLFVTPALLLLTTSLLVRTNEYACSQIRVTVPIDNPLAYEFSASL